MRSGDEAKKDEEKNVHDCVVYVLCDMEGAFGVTSMDDCVPGTGRWRVAGRELTLEAAAVARGALRAGAGRVIVHDTHAWGVNMHPDLIPPGVEFRQGHALSPVPILGDVPRGALVVLLACHVGAGQGGHLPHTFRTRFTKVALDGRAVGEAELYAYLLAAREAAVAVVTGDASATDEAKAVMPWVRTVEAKRGAPPSSDALALHALLEATVTKAVTAFRERPGSVPLLTPPREVELAVSFVDASAARSHRCGRWRREGSTLSRRGDFGAVFRAFLEMAYMGRLSPLAGLAVPMVRRWALWRYGRP